MQGCQPGLGGALPPSLLLKFSTHPSSAGLLTPQQGYPGKGACSWTQTDTGGPSSCLFSGSLNLAKPCGLGHLTVLSAQAGRDNGIFHRLPVCSDRKLLMPHCKMVSGGGCANSAPSHLIYSFLPIQPEV